MALMHGVVESLRLAWHCFREVAAVACNYPSAFTLLWWIQSWPSWSQILHFEVSLRCSKCFGALLHEYAHLIVGAVVSGRWMKTFSIPNFLGNLPMTVHLLQLCPGMPCRSCTCVDLPHCKEWPASAIVSSAGVIASAAILMVAINYFTSPMCIAAFMNLCSAIISDGPFLLSRLSHSGLFGCGNWGLLCPTDLVDGSELFPRALQKILIDVISVVELRGGQAGGLCLFVEDMMRFSRRSPAVKAILAKAVKPKRGILAKSVFAELSRSLRRHQRASCWGLRKLPVVLAQGHSRFGTSSAPSVVETHPHQWCPPTQELVWKFNDSTQAWEAETVQFIVTITHNGDFDAWQPYDEMVGNGDIGCWLERILHCSNNTAGDSPKLCGIMNMLITKGSWFRSVRLALALDILVHVEQVSNWSPLSKSAPNGMVPEKVMREWGDAFHAAFKHYYLLEHTPLKMYGSHQPEPATEGDEEQEDIAGGLMLKDLVKTIHSHLGRQKFSDEAARLLEEMVPSESRLRANFVMAVVKNFLRQDVMTAVWEFFRRAEGTFAISVTCSVEPDACVLASRGQPLSIALNPTTGLAVWASEPASLAATCPQCKYRFDLRDDTGEILELRIKNGDLRHPFLGPSCYSPLAKALYIPVAHFQSHHASFRGGESETQQSLLFRGSSMNGVPVLLEPRDLQSRFVSLRAIAIDSPLKAAGIENERTSRKPWWQGSDDVIQQDLKSIPKVLNQIDQNWQDPESLNYATAGKFAQMILHRASLPKCSEVPEIDVLVVGIEGSHWLGQQFVADLVRLFPTLHAVALSANFVLGMLHHEEGRVPPLGFPLNRHTFRLAHGAVCLALSQSGTTYPIVWSARLLSQLKDVHVFACSGHFDTVLASSLGQRLAGHGFNKRVFSTMCGVRPAEPSTVASVAMHHTLSHILLVCVKQACGNEDLVTMPVRGVADFERVLRSLAVTSQSACGVDFFGHPVPSQFYDELQHMGKLWASHLVEGYWATLLGALYVFITVIGGVPIFGVIWKIVDASLDDDDINETVPIAVTRVLDAFIYVFLAAIISMLHRVVTGRRLWTRFTGRSLVIVDANTTNYKLLRAYVSKLRALAFRFTTFGVSGQNGTDHFVHEMTHLTTSEVLIAVGRPDGRLASLAATEASMIMAVQQAKFIKKGSTGVECLSLGQNPWTNAKLFTRHMAIPTDARPFFLSETLGVSDSAILDRKIGKNPSDCLQWFASLRAGKASELLPCPQVTLSELRQNYLDGRDAVSRTEAENAISSLLKDQQNALGIDVGNIDVQGLMKHITIPGADFAQNDNSSTSQNGSRGPRQKLKNLMSGVFERVMSSASSNSGKSTSVSRHSPAGGDVSIVQLMSVLRSADMKKKISSAQKARKRRRRLLTLSHSALKNTGPNVSVADAFVHWKLLLLRRPPIGHKEAAGDWRHHEAVRTAITSNPLSIVAWGLSLLFCFRAWRDAMFTTVRPGGKSRIFGSWQDPALKGTAQALDMQEVGEHLYETRVAAAERLISFLVLFHRMVKPISRVPFLGFDMDRTESRLRVASTPAPVAMRDTFTRKEQPCRDSQHSVIAI